VIHRTEHISHHRRDGVTEAWIESVVLNADEEEISKERLIQDRNKNKEARWSKDGRKYLYKGGSI